MQIIVVQLLIDFRQLQQHNLEITASYPRPRE